MKKGTILIVTTWILAIVTLFAIGIGFRVGLEMKLTGYKLDSLKARYIAKAGIKKAVIKKWEEYIEGKSLGVDAFSEDWANDEEGFKDAKIGEGSVSLIYVPGDIDREEKKTVLYGLEDECGKIDINSAKALAVLKNMLLESDIELEQAEIIIASIEDWRDEDTVQKSGSGAEDEYYNGLEEPYKTAGRDFVAVEELLLVRGVDKRIFDKILAGRITVYGDGKININTASVEVIDALFGIGYPDLAPKVADYRKGVDGKIGTDDDRWFSIGQMITERGDKGMAYIKDLNEENWYGNIFGITEQEYKKIKELAGKDGLLSTRSDYYRATATARVNKVTKRVASVFKFNPPAAVRNTGFAEEIPPPDMVYLFWHEDR
jgi:general secretion pathway protein K